MAKKEGKVPRGPSVDVVVKHTVELGDLGEDSVNSQYTRPGGRVQTSPSQVIWQGWSEGEEMSEREIGRRERKSGFWCWCRRHCLYCCCARGGLDCCLLCLAGVAGVAGGALEAHSFQAFDLRAQPRHGPF